METIDLELERKEILKRYRKLLRTAKPLLKDNDAKLIKKAFNTSLEAHKDMRRKSGEPYIYHPLAVAQIAAEEIGLGTTSIVSALLHDVVEDTELESEDIRRDFGPKIARIIDGLTKIAGVFEYGTSQQAENFRKMLLTLSDDVRVILIKLADRLHNMRTLESMPRNSQLKIASETMYLYAPLAHRLGLYTIKSELEDLFLKFTEAESYQQIATDLKETKAARDRFIREFIAPLEEDIGLLGFEYVIKGRPKSIYSIWSKMKKQKIPFEEVYDLFAIRIILKIKPEHEKAACWQVYSIVTDYYKPNPDRLRDWISTPRANGYESLHSTVMSKAGQWVEVQIRTERMDEIAEKGYAAHWKYKENTPQHESGLETWIRKVRDMLEHNDYSAIEFVDEFRSNLFTEEVFVFTPKGDLRVLPHGATALDFAFEIHSEIGFRCLGAKVNQKLVPLSYILNNGDQVEVLTSSKQKPSEDWLRFVVSSKARTRIREFLKEDKKRYVTDGKELVIKKFRNLKLPVNNEMLNQLRAYFNVKTVNDLLYNLGKGYLDAQEIRKFKADRLAKSNGHQPAILDAKSFEKEIKKVRGVELMSNYGYRIIKAKWTSHNDLAFLAGLRITGTDRVGIVNDITRIISGELKVNMRSITIDTNDGIFEGTIMLFVHDTGHLETLMKKLAKVAGVVGVTRFDS